MDKKEEFKTFAKEHPELITHVTKGDMTWQKFYEIYDIYGNEETIWQEYYKKLEPKKEIPKKVITNTPKKVETTTDANTKKNGISSLGDLTNILKKVDTNSIQKHIGTAQKAIGLFQELTKKDVAAGALGAAGLAATAKPTSSRPLNKFFED